jgi:hypothetical protein
MLPLSVALGCCWLLLLPRSGFEVQQTGIWNEIKGRGGLDLREKYSDGIRTLLGVHSRGFPNMFVMGGYQVQRRPACTCIARRRTVWSNVLR